MPDQILTRREVEAITSLGKSTIYAMMGVGRFPKNVKLGLHRVGWKSSEIAAWVADPVSWGRK